MAHVAHAFDGAAQAGSETTRQPGIDSCADLQVTQHGQLLQLDTVTVTV